MRPGDESATCATCMYWRSDQPALATGVRRPRGADVDVGACTLLSPTVWVVAGMATSLFPETHRDRTCGSWVPPFDDGGGGPDDGEVVVPFARPTSQVAA